ncbi:MAG TPA: ABC transporter substrate-binding protein [Pyrinomonadaceae bacterium]|nr:ABC transporter substrate-binding protein [Pyrinomonadaceae bacterium]
MTWMNRMFSRSLAAALCISIIAACGGPVSKDSPHPASTGQETGVSGGTLVYRLASPLKTLNYYLADDEPSVIVTLFLINDRLVTFDHAKQEHVPMLAESYTVADDGVTVDLTLREGLKFSDGRPLTTADVEFTLESIYDERTQSRIFRDSLLVAGKEIKPKVIDERRMQMVFPEKVAAVQNYFENLAVMPKHILENSFKAGTLAEQWKITADPKTVVTSGAFSVDSVQAGERIALKRNPHYWKRDEAGNQLPYLESLVLEIVGDPNNTFARLQQNTIDIVDRIRATDYAVLKTTESSVKPSDAGPGLSTDHMWFNLNPAKQSGESLSDQPKYKWFTDKLFRRAVAHSIDRTSISKNALQGLATPLYGFVPVGNRVWRDPDLANAEYDLDKARTLLKEAGFVVRDNAGKPVLADAAGNRVTFTLIVPAENEPRKLMAAVIQEDLAKLGIEMQIAPIDFQGAGERWSTSFDYDALLMGLSQTGTDPSGFSMFLKSSGSVHQWQPKQATPATEWEARVDELVMRISQESNSDERHKMFNEIQAIFAEEMPIIPVVSRHVVSAANVRVGNFAPASFLPFSLWNAERLYVKK